MNNTCPRLIEVALPVREISAESVRDKSLRHGHISTLHLWWARRPLAACRAVVFASLVFDPDDPRCPEDFKEAVEKYLKTNVPEVLKYYYRGRKEVKDSDPYRPYDGMEDTLRNRLLMFIAKWSKEAIEFEKGKNPKPPKPKELLDDRSLIKWETSDPENKQGKEILRIARELVKIANQGKTPMVLDPFAGGGAIPLEAGRLGCQPIANDYNPVAYLILRATCEFPQKYGKPGKRKVIKKEWKTQKEVETEVPNVLVHDVEKWANWILENARQKIGHLYPPGKDGRPVVGYLWARTAPCANPSCRGKIPLLRSLLICKLRNGSKRIALTMVIDKRQKTVSFGIAKGKEIKRTEGTIVSRGVKCPFCGQITHVDTIKEASFNGQLGERIVAVIVEGKNGKDYRHVEEIDIKAFKKVKNLIAPFYIPNELMPDSPDLVSGRGWNFKTWGSLFNPRQLVAMQIFVQTLHEALDKMKKDMEDEEYWKAVGIYLGLWVSKIAVRLTNMGRWSISRETLETPFDKQALPMKWDYVEANPFTKVTGGMKGQLTWISRFLIRESNPYIPSDVICGDGAHLYFSEQSMDAVVTDPPYFDAIAYSDLSDFFYVWLKRALDEVIPEIFITPLTPKSEEATALKHRHNGNMHLADKHFTTKLAQVLADARRVTKKDGIIVVMFAHQSTKAWTALINALFEAGLTIDATWPIDTELKNRAVALGTSALESSITVTCRPRITGSAASFKDVKKEIKQVVQEAVKRFWSYGLRGADLIVACYGPAVGVFGKYERVEKGDGTVVEISELLKLAREAARDAIAGEFKGDEISTLYYVWANLYGVSEQAWDDARLVVQIGSDSQDSIEAARKYGIFVINGSKCRLALLADRIKKDLGKNKDCPLIDALHRAMFLWKTEKRQELISYLSKRNLLEDSRFWKLAQALFEVLPRDIEDWKLINALLSERSTLKTESKQMKPQGSLLDFMGNS
jgi:adenine-specific DNA methylase